jgi:hypothetical protein
MEEAAALEAALVRIGGGALVGAVNLTVCFLCGGSACWGILGVEEVEELEPAWGTSRAKKEAVVLAGDGR